MNKEIECRICKARQAPFMSFGNMPLANAFISPDQFEQEYFFNLSVCFCPECFAVQIAEQPAPELMFHENYPFFTSSSSFMVKHFADFAQGVRERYLQGDDPFVVELGSNDGTLLKNFQQKGIRHLGVEPSESVARMARQKGVETETEFFNESLARKMVDSHGKADVCLAANLMCHIPDLHTVLRAAKILLKEKGVLTFEDPYLGDVLEKNSYDQIYDEHVYLFSLHSIQSLCHQHELQLIDAEAQPTHGGSMRYTVARQGVYPVHPRVNQLLDKEKVKGFGKQETYDAFRGRCENSKQGLTQILKDLHGQGKRVIGYAATSKSTTVINYCDIQPEWIEFIADTTPMKQGKFSPGKHIPIRDYEAFKKNPPDYALLFGWNHREEIMAKEKSFTDSGGKWITYVPEVAVL